MVPSSAWIVLVLVLALSRHGDGIVQVPDPCEQYTNISDPWRNRGFSSGSSRLWPKNDSDLQEGWYRFTGVGGDTLDYVCVGPSPPKVPGAAVVDHWGLCGNHISNGYPGLFIREKAMQLCAKTSSGCNSTGNADVKICSGGYYVHKLKPTNNQSYATRHYDCKDFSCGERAQCGSFGACECEPGYEMAKGVVPTGNTYGCTDADECTEPGKCEAHQDCVNTEGSYYCDCASGYLPNVFPNNTITCIDADECTEPGKCEAHQDCVNTEGSYYCDCASGYLPHVFPNNTITCIDQENLDAECKDAQLGVCIILDLIKTLSLMKEKKLQANLASSVLGKMLVSLYNMSGHTAVEGHTLVQHANRVLNRSEDVFAILMPEDVNLIHNFGINMSSAELQQITIGVDSKPEDRVVHIKARDAQLDIDLYGLANLDGTGRASAALLVFTNMEEVLLADYFITAEQSGGNRKNTTLVSKVVSVSLPNMSITQLPSPVNLTLRHKKVVDPQGELYCVYWNASAWVVDGCHVTYTNNTHTVCTCKHLSTFALVMQVDVPEDMSERVKLATSILEEILESLSNLSGHTAVNGHTLVQHANSVLNRSEDAVAILVPEHVKLTSHISIHMSSAELQQITIGKHLKPNDRVVHIKARDAQLDIELYGLAKVDGTGMASAALLVFTSMEEVLPADYFFTAEQSGGNRKNTTLVSKVVSVSLPKMSITQLPTPVNLTLRHINVVDLQGELSCVYWKASVWVVDGCHVTYTNTTHTVCTCEHLSTFALVMQVDVPEDMNEGVKRNLLKSLALVIGLLFLSLTLLTFALCALDPKVTNVARLNLCISLFQAHLLALLVQEFILHILPHKVVCRVLSGLQKILFLSGFHWMQLDTLLLFLSIKKLKKPRGEGPSWVNLTLIGYGVPLVIMGVVFGLLPDGYGAEWCGVQSQDGLSWSLLGPAYLMFTINVSLLLIALISLCLLSPNEYSVQKDIRMIRCQAVRVISQSVVIMSPWILGFFWRGSGVLDIIFIILTSQQGTFLFLIHCVFNREVHSLCKRMTQKLVAFLCPFYATYSVKQK